MTDLSLAFDNTREDGHAILMAATGFLSTQGAYDPDIELALAEAINNVIDHAYPCAGWGELHLATTQDDVVCIVTDHGKIYAPPERGETLGYGWHLMRSIAKDVSIKRTFDQNRLELTFARSELA